MTTGAKIVLCSAVIVFLVLQFVLDARVEAGVTIVSHQNDHEYYRDDDSSQQEVTVTTTSSIPSGNTHHSNISDADLTTFNGWNYSLRPPFPPNSRPQQQERTAPFEDETTITAHNHNRHELFNNSTSRPIISPDKLNKHPYLGLVDEHGNLGYVHDPQAHLRHPLAFSIEASNTESTSSICDPPQTPDEWIGYQVLQNHLQVFASISSDEPPPPPTPRTPSSAVSNIPPRPPRILCAIYTHAGATPQTQAIRQTWGRKCDGLLFASTVTNHSTLHVQLKHDSKWEGGYRGLWQRTRALMAYLYQHHSDHLLLKDYYDYFHICGDDTFVIVENLRAFLSSPAVSNVTTAGQPFFGGFWTHWGKPNVRSADKTDFYYLGGGAGYTMNAKALQLYVEKKALDRCRKNRLDGPAEDWNIAWCFRDAIGLTGFDTRDDQGRHRYHVLNHQRHALFPERKYGMASHIVRQSLQFMETHHGFPIGWGKEYISPYSVAFHDYKTPEKMKQFEYWLYGTGREQCEKVK
jgi:hypothetical protein